MRVDLEEELYGVLRRAWSVETALEMSGREGFLHARDERLRRLLLEFVVDSTRPRVIGRWSRSR